MVREKLARVVTSAYRPLSSDLSENPMAWTTKSIVPHSSLSRSNTWSTVAMSSTSHGSISFEPTLSASGFTLRPKPSPW
jgi:hypothetical protein